MHALQSVKPVRSSHAHASDSWQLMRPETWTPAGRWITRPSATAIGSLINAMPGRERQMGEDRRTGRRSPRPARYLSLTYCANRTAPHLHISGYGAEGRTHPYTSRWSHRYCVRRLRLLVGSTDTRSAQWSRSARRSRTCNSPRPIDLIFHTTSSIRHAG